MQRVVIIYIKMQGYIFCKILSGWKGSRGNMKLSRQGKIIQKKGKKLSKSGLKMRLGRFKNQKFSYPGEGDTPSPGPHPPQPRPCGPRRVHSDRKSQLFWPWSKWLHPLVLQNFRIPATFKFSEGLKCNKVFCTGERKLHDYKA